MCKQTLLAGVIVLYITYCSNYVICFIEGICPVRPTLLLLLDIFSINVRKVGNISMHMVVYYI